MNYLKTLFGKQDEVIKSYNDFWKWFLQKEKIFFSVVKNNQNIEEGFFDILSPKLEQLKDGYFYLTGMLDDNTAELVFTADGNLQNIVFVEELVNSAPEINGWKFTAHKEPINIEKFSIAMNGYEFNAENISFCVNEIPEYPDEIDINIIYHDLNNENKEIVCNGVYIFLDNFLGEIDFINRIDNFKVIGKQDVTSDVIPIEKLKSYLDWRQKEFLAKYEGIWYDSEEDDYSIIEAEAQNSNPLIIVIKSDLLKWENKASHPWILILVVNYDGENSNGMPNSDDYDLLNIIEEALLVELKASDGYINIGRQIGNGVKEIYFACKDFRKPSKVFYETQQKYANKFDINYEIYKDKYWQSFEKFQ